jgi:hypothetical protein
MGHMRTTAASVLLAVLTTLVAACGAGDEEHNVRARRGVTSGSSPAVEMAAQTCERRGTGEGGATGIGDKTPDPSWRARSLVVGPVGFLNFDDYANLSEDQFDAARPGSAANSGTILTVIVQAGFSTTIEIAPEARNSALLLDTTAPLHAGRLSLGDGVSTIRLDACQAMDTDFRIGLIPTRAQCVPLDVSTASASAPTRVVLPLGMACPVAGIVAPPGLTG